LHTTKRLSVVREPLIPVSGGEEARENGGQRPWALHGNPMAAIRRWRRVVIV
jgi:hypothetical protein